MKLRNYKWYRRWIGGIWYKILTNNTYINSGSMWTKDPVIWPHEVLLDVEDYTKLKPTI